ncbi:MAG: RNA polymerase sigma factor [Thermoleophilia bacterium]
MDGFVAPAPRSRFALPRKSLRAAGDERLVAQIRSGDGPAARTAFEVLYDRHHRGVLAFCRHMLGSFEEAEDAVQHTFSSAYRALLRDDREIALRAWLYAIARNRCLSMLAARREQVALDDVGDQLPSTTGLAREVEQRSDLRELLADMQLLPEAQRAALVLAELEAHSHKEIGEILGVPPAKVKALVFQARESLMIRRQARDTSCTEIREQLSVLRGGALRRRELRRHLESCEGCRLFEADVRRQRAGMAVLLPVAPTLALKNSTLATAFATTTSAAAGIGAISGGGAVAGLAIGTKAMGAKVLAVLAVAGGAGGGGYVAVNEVTGSGRAPAPATVPAGSAPAVPSTQAPRPAAAPIVAPAAASGAARRGASGAGRSSSSAGGSGAGRAADPAGDRASAGGRSDAARAGRPAKSERPAAKRRRAPSAKRRETAKSGDAGQARREARRRAAAERRAATQREALLRKRRAEAALRAKQRAATAAPQPATPPAAPSSQGSARTLEAGSAGSGR